MCSGEKLGEIFFISLLQVIETHKDWYSIFMQLVTFLLLLHLYTYINVCIK